MSKEKAKKILTNIRAREVSLVDNSANKKDFLLVKSEDGEMEQVSTKPSVEKTEDDKTKAEAKKEGESEDKKEIEILKKLEIAMHSINFIKHHFPQKEDAIKVLKANDIDPTKLKMVENDFEFRFIINPSEKFEGSSLVMGTYIPMNIGVDSMVGIMKGMDEGIQKKGAKISSARLQKLKDMKSSLDSILSDFEVLEDEDTEKKEDVTKSDDSKKVEDQNKVKEDNMSKELEEKIKKQDETIEKNDKSIEEKDKSIGEKDKKIVDLEKRVLDLEQTPADKQAEEVDKTQEVSKNQKSMWAGIL